MNRNPLDAQMIDLGRQVVSLSRAYFVIGGKKSTDLFTSVGFLGIIGLACAFESTWRRPLLQDSLVAKMLLGLTYEISNWLKMD